MRTRRNYPKIAYQIVASLLIVAVISMAICEFFQVASWTQNWVGKFTLTWGVALLAFISFGLFVIVLAVQNLWQVEFVQVVNSRLVGVRDRLGWFRWLLVLLFVFIPVKLILYTPLGFIFPGIGFRLIIFLIAALVLAFLLTRQESGLFEWQASLVGMLILGSVFALAKSLVSVVDYPLSLTWSEGNRIWDYSVLFGRGRYIYPQDRAIKAYIDTGRQTLWGLPFLFPDVTLMGVRLWSALVFTVPYALLGWVALRPVAGNRKAWLLFGLWTFLFISQGPVYTPLILSAILVVGVRRKPLWIALPLIFLAGNYAQSSRITWMAAPAIWAVMVALLDVPSQKGGNISLRNWGVIAAFGLSGFLGGFGLIRGWRSLYNYITRAIADNATTPTPTPSVAQGTVYINPSDAAEVISSGAQETFLSNQPLVISRLFPNPTYNLGILLGLLLAVGPILILLVYLVRRKHWKLNAWQQTGLFGILAALMLVGVVISLKIGGGGDLHNLDMFLISLVLAVALAWEHGGHRWLVNLVDQPLGIRLVLLLAVAVPAFMPWVDAHPLELPPQDKLDWTMELLQSETSRVVADGGEILFMDQRQLLTFGYLGDIPLVPEYEKKLVMDRAMSSDRAYFKDFYDDLANQRFDLIITDPQRIRFSDEDEGWGAENDTWVEWVTKPLLCYYDPQYTIKKTGVWILVPAEDPGDCIVP